MTGFLKNLAGFISIILVSLFIFESTCRLLHVPKITYHNIYAKSQSLVPLINENSILILGDSRLEWGIKPLTIRNKLKDNRWNVINMALPGSNGLDVLSYLKNNSIYPRLIIMGYSPNFGRYENHNLDSITYSTQNAITEKIQYFLLQSFYFRDRSVLEYMEKGFPYFKSNTYDDWGGAVVYEYGNYSRRSDFQANLYTQFKNSFDSLALKKFCNQVNNYIPFFKKGGTSICGLYMPVSRKIFNIENVVADSGEVKINFDRYYDFSNYIYATEKPAPDSIYFYDGSHLSHEYAYVFSEKLVNNIQKDYPYFK